MEQRLQEKATRCRIQSSEALQLRYDKFRKDISAAIAI
jgi:hypothetical protein